MRQTESCGGKLGKVATSRVTIIDPYLQFTMEHFIVFRTACLSIAHSFFTILSIFCAALVSNF